MIEKKFQCIKNFAATASNITKMCVLNFAWLFIFELGVSIIILHLPILDFLKMLVLKSNVIKRFIYHWAVFCILSSSFEAWKNKPRWRCNLYCITTIVANLLVGLVAAIIERHRCHRWRFVCSPTLGPVISTTELPTARHRCDVSSELFYPGAKP